MTLREHPSRGVEHYRVGQPEGELRGLLTAGGRLFAETFPQVDAASLALGSPGEPGLLVASSSLAQAADGMQFQASAGPVFDAFDVGRPVRTENVVGDERWPSLHGYRAPADQGQGEVHGAVALPMVCDEVVVGVVSLYSVRIGGFGDDAVTWAAPFAATAERLVRDDRELARMRVVTEQLQEALRSRAVIDQAKGMVMIARGCGPDEAFDALRRMSNRSNRKLRDVAAEMVAEASRRRP